MVIYSEPTLSLIARYLNAVDVASLELGSEYVLRVTSASGVWPSLLERDHSIAAKSRGNSKRLCLGLYRTVPTRAMRVRTVEAAQLLSALRWHRRALQGGQAHQFSVCVASFSCRGISERDWLISDSICPVALSDDPGPRIRFHIAMQAVPFSRGCEGRIALAATIDSQLPRDINGWTGWDGLASLSPLGTSESESEGSSAIADQRSLHLAVAISLVGTHRLFHFYVPSTGYWCRPKGRSTHPSGKGRRMPGSEDVHQPSGMPEIGSPDSLEIAAIISVNLDRLAEQREINRLLTQLCSI